MPVFPEIARDLNGICEVHGQHSCRCPAVKEPGVWRIASIRIPDGGEVGRPVISAVGIILEGEAGAFAADASIQEPPEASVVELREIGHGILRRSHSRTLGSADIGGHGLLNAVTAFCSRGARCRRHVVWSNVHRSRQAGGVAVVVKLPPALILPPAVVHPVIPVICMGFSLTVSPAIRMLALFPIFYPHPILLPPGRPDAPGG